METTNNSKRELIYRLTKKDFIIQTFRSGGKGGQNQNKRDTGVRIIHQESGARGEARDERSQLQNKRSAFLRLVEDPKFKIWHAKKIFEYNKGKDYIEKEVERLMSPKYIKTEIHDENGNWIEVPTTEELSDVDICSAGVP